MSEAFKTSDRVRELNRLAVRRYATRRAERLGIKRAFPRSPAPTVAEKILARSIPEPNTGCWLWDGALTGSGYGTITIDGRTIGAHRASFGAFRGEIPDGLQLDHICRVTSCVNPAHLEPVTNRENQVRGVGFVARNARATHCPRGHEYTEANTRRHRGRRFCRACHREECREYHSANRAELNRRRRQRREARHGF